MLSPRCGKRSPDDGGCTRYTVTAEAARVRKAWDLRSAHGQQEVREEARDGGASWTHTGVCASRRWTQGTARSGGGAASSAGEHERTCTGRTPGNGPQIGVGRCLNGHGSTSGVAESACHGTACISVTRRRPHRKIRGARAPDIPVPAQAMSGLPRRVGRCPNERGYTSGVADSAFHGTGRHCRRAVPRPAAAILASRIRRQRAQPRSLGDRPVYVSV